MKYGEIKIGDTAEISHTITEKDIDKFVDLTGDDNKLHVNKDFASRTEFKQPVVHGMLGASFISTLIGTKLPGDGALWFSQTLDFLRPVRIGDTIRVHAEVVDKNDKASSIGLKVEIYNQNKQLVTSGLSKVKVVDIEGPEAQDITIAKQVENKTVLIIGASGGIGRAVAMKLAEDGYDLLLHYYSKKDVVDDLIGKIELLGRKAVCVKADLLNDKDINEFLFKIKREFTSLTGFVNCSTVKIPNIKYGDLEWNIMQEQIDINIKSNFHLLAGLLPFFEKNKYGKIVFIGTMAVDQPNSEWLHYITAKAALTGFVKALAIEYASKGINVNMVSPSMIDTDLVVDVPKKMKMLIEAKTPLRRLCTPHDVAEAISYLISEKSDFITGETIRINGGQVML